MKKILALVLALLMVFALAACGGGGDDADSANTPSDTQTDDGNAGDDGDGESFYIGISMNDVSGGFGSALAEYAEQYCLEEGWEVTVVTAAKDANLQASQVENMITSGVDLILLQPGDLSGCGPISTACQENNIPLISMNHEITSWRTCAVDVDEYTVGQIMAQEMVERLGGEGNVVMITGRIDQVSWVTQAEGARDYFEQCPGITILDEQTSNFDLNTAKSLLENWLANGWQIDGIWASADAMGYTLESVLVDNGIDFDDIVIVGREGQLEGLEAVQNGILDCTLRLTPEQHARMSVDIAKQLLNGEELETDYITIEPEIVDSTNVDAVIEQYYS